MRYGCYWFGILTEHQQARDQYLAICNFLSSMEIDDEEGCSKEGNEECEEDKH